MPSSRCPYEDLISRLSFPDLAVGPKALLYQDNGVSTVRVHALALPASKNHLSIRFGLPEPSGQCSRNTHSCESCDDVHENTRRAKCSKANKTLTASCLNKLATVSIRCLMSLDPEIMGHFQGIEKFDL